MTLPLHVWSIPWENGKISTLASMLESIREEGGKTGRALAAYLPRPPRGPVGQLEEPDFCLAGTQGPEGGSRGRLRGRERGWSSTEVAQRGRGGAAGRPKVPVHDPTQNRSLLPELWARPAA